jgi:hypothetical protein
MSFTFPSRDKRQWRCAQNGDSFGVLVGTKNVDLDDEGYLKLAPRTVKMYGNDSDADFDRVVAVNCHGSSWWAFTDDDNFTFDVGATNATQDAETGAFASCSDALVYGTTQWASRDNSASLSYRSTGAWSTLAASLTTSKPHPLCVFASAQQIAVGDVNKVRLVTTPDGTPGMSDTILTLPARFTVTSIAYSDSKLYIGTKVSTGDAFLFVWDGATMSAQYGYPVSTNYVASVAPYESSVAILTAQGQILRFNGGGFDEIAALPHYYSGLDWAQNTGSTHVGHRALAADGSLLYANVGNGSFAAPSGFADKRHAAPDMTPAGVWVYDPAVGLYHRHGPSQAKRYEETVASASIDAATDVITVAAAPATGTPVVFQQGGALGGVAEGTVYFTIKLSGTTVKLASTRALAALGTAVDITSVEAATSFFFWFFPETDFGQYLSENAWCVRPYRNEDQGAQFWEASRVFFGGETATATNLTASSECLNTAVFQIPNRGYMVTAKVQAEAITEGAPQAYVRFRPLATAEDKIVVKHRRAEKAGFPIRYASVTWTDGDTFTTTDTRFANVAAGHEIEVIAGRASGCLAHVSSISGTSTYTVNLDESFPEVAASDVSYVTVDNWEKKVTVTTATETNERGFASVPVNARDAVFHQFKVELRGADVAVREIFVPTAEGRNY